MRKQLLYILCVIGSMLITIDMAYLFADDLKEFLFPAPTDKTPIAYGIFHNMTLFLAFAGWCYITYKVARKEYKWQQKLDKTL